MDVCIAGDGEMAYQHREKRISQDIRQLNLGFLRLLVEPAPCPSPARCGLDGLIVTRVARLSTAELDALAGAPCLLATVPLDGYAAERRLAAEPAAHGGSGGAWIESARLYTVGLLVYVWQIARTDPYLASLCLDRPDVNVPALAGLGLHEVHELATTRAARLRARFAGNRRLWPDLLRAATRGDPELLHVTRLSVLQLAVAR